MDLGRLRRARGRAGDRGRGAAWGWVLAGRVVDRLGKGARSSPRDALIRDSTPATVDGRGLWLPPRDGHGRRGDRPLSPSCCSRLGSRSATILWFAVVPGGLTLLLLRRLGGAGQVAPRQHQQASELTAGASRRCRASSGRCSGSGSCSRSATRATRSCSSARTTSASTSLLACSRTRSTTWSARRSPGPRPPLGSDPARLAARAAGWSSSALVYLGFARGFGVVGGLAAVRVLRRLRRRDRRRRGVHGSADHAHTGSVGTAYGVFYAATAGAALLRASPPVSSGRT